MSEADCLSSFAPVIINTDTRGHHLTETNKVHLRIYDRQSADDRPDEGTPVDFLLRCDVMYTMFIESQLSLLIYVGN